VGHALDMSCFTAWLMPKDLDKAGDQAPAPRCPLHLGRTLTKCHNPQNATEIEMLMLRTLIPQWAFWVWLQHNCYAHNLLLQFITVQNNVKCFNFNKIPPNMKLSFQHFHFQCWASICYCCIYPPFLPLCSLHECVWTTHCVRVHLKIGQKGCDFEVGLGNGIGCRHTLWTRRASS